MRPRKINDGILVKLPKGGEMGRILSRRKFLQQLGLVCSSLALAIGSMCSASAENGLCPQITGSQAHIECVLTPIPPSRVYDADEVFLSSTAGGLIPATTVDDRRIGDGKPGPITNQLNASYWSKREAGWYATPIDYR